MKKKNSVSLIIFLVVFFTILYVLLAAKPLAKEYQFTPVWKISTSNPTVKNSISQNKMYYHLGQTAGYFTENGDITLNLTFPSKISISNTYFAPYENDSTNIPFFNADNEQVGIIQATGFPYFVDDQIYVFSPGGSSFAKCLSNGDVTWRYEGTIPLTSFSAKQKYTAIGLADGTIKVFENETGLNEISFEIGGSDFPVILGLDISLDGQYVACISGHDKQRFVLSHKEENQQKIIFHKFLDSDSPYRTSVYFAKNSPRVLYNYGDKLGIYDFSSSKNKELSIKNKIISIKENEDFIFLLSKNKNDYTVSIIENTNTKEGEFSFKAQTAFIQVQENKLYIGKDNSIACIDLTKN